MRRYFYIAALLLLGAAACSQRFEVDLPLALNRTEMRFTASGNTFYVLVYSDGPWTAALDKDVPWVSLSRTSGDGNTQILVTTAVNTGVSRGVTLTVSNAHGSRDMYISQAQGLSEGGIYSFVKEGVELLRGASAARIMAGTNLDDDTIAGVRDTVMYATPEEDWVRDIEVSRTKVVFRVDENTTGAERSATVRLTFPLAKWDTPVTSFFLVHQSVSEPAEIGADILPLEGAAASFAEDDRLTLLDSDGSSTLPATLQGASTLLFNADAVRSGILGGIYPEDYVSRWSGGKVYLTLPAEQDFRSSLARAADLVLLAGKKDGERIALRSAVTLLRLDISGEGTLRALSLSAGLPLAGDGTIDMGAESPSFEAGAAGASVITVRVPEEGVSLPARCYLAIPSGNLGRLTVHATTTRWSGSIAAESTTVGEVHQIVPLEEIRLRLPSEATSLTDGGRWANCFLLEDLERRMYSIGIRRPDGSIPAEDISRCSILWETAPNVLDYLAIDESGSRLYFRKSASLAGSAHVAVENAQGIVRWSYHIWAPATPVGTRCFGKYTLMDRNLGAVQADASDYSGASIGMHYQWGRKDPFPPSAQTGTGGNGNHGKVYPDNITFITAQEGVSQEIADASPTTYFWGSGASGNQDWRAPQDDRLWESGDKPGNPCPYGWTVPGNDALELIAARMTGVEFVSRVGLTIQDDDGASVLFAPGGYYRRSSSTDSEMANMGDGWIWSSTPLEGTTPQGSWRLWYQSNLNNRKVDKTYPQRRWGGNVRCVKVQQL